MLRGGVAIPYPDLQDILRRAGVTHGMGRFECEQRIRPFQNEILTWAYRRMASTIRANGGEPIWVYLPQMGDHVTDTQLDGFVRLAEDAGFRTISLADCFDGHDPATVIFGPWDHHPNNTGHRLIGDKLFERLQEGFLGTARAAQKAKS